MTDTTAAAVIAYAFVMKLTSDVHCLSLTVIELLPLLTTYRTANFSLFATYLSVMNVFLHSLYLCVSSLARK